MAEPELGWCKCGREATIALEAGGRRVAFCDACWKRAAEKAMADLKTKKLRGS